MPDIVQVEEDKMDMIKACFNLSDEDIDIEKPNKELKTFMDNNEIEYIDLYDELKTKKDLYMEYDIHFDEKGHELIAEILSEKLENGKE